MNDVTKICIAVLAGFALLIGGPISCTMAANNRVLDAIKAGADPMDAACAFKGDISDKICIASAHRSEPRQ